MVFGILRRWRRRRLLARPLPQSRAAWFERLPFWPDLSAEERARLVEIARVLVAEKSWEGCGGLALDDDIRFSIAASAALLVVHRARQDYPNVASILVYPHAFVDPTAHVDATGVVSEGRASHGLAWMRGPVVLDWSEARHGIANDMDGRNLVLHEFAHKLDMLDGFADGRPPLVAVQPNRWRDVMLREYEALCRADERGRATLLDKYGAINPAEFFAVATETFFEKGGRMRRRHAGLYALLGDYYGYDTAAWRRR